MAAVPAAQADDRSAVEAAIAEVKREMRVVLTCSATEPESHDILVRGWQEQVAKTRDLLVAAGWSADEAAAFAEDAAPARLIASELSFGQVIALCRFNADWMRRARMARLPRLDVEVEKALGRK